MNAPMNAECSQQRFIRSTSRPRIEFDYPDGRVFVNGEVIQLTPREADVLEVLRRNQGSALSSAAISERVSGAWDENPITLNMVHVMIHHLRVKLGKELIQTVPGYGYRL